MLGGGAAGMAAAARAAETGVEQSVVPGPRTGGAAPGPGVGATG